MNRNGKVEQVLRARPPNGSVFVLDLETEDFFNAETGIRDREELKRHIIEVQEEAYKVFPYPCIRRFTFTGLKIAKEPAYPRVHGLLKNRPEAIFLDIGCCMGTEVRKVIHDGWPISQTVGTDIEAGFWDAGHKLFRTTPENYPAKFLAGDMFENTHLDPTVLASCNAPSVASVDTLTELRGHISVIHASALFHLFGEEKQFELAKRIASLLDPRPGSIIFGSHFGSPVKGIGRVVFIEIFAHSPESWKELWEQIFEKGQVKVTAALEKMDIVGETENSGLTEGLKTSYWFSWSIERL